MTDIKSRQSGVGMIELLIAVLVLAVGVLGLVGLQINAKRMNLDAMQRTMALQLTEDLISRMRRNAFDNDLESYASDADNDGLADLDTATVFGGGTIGTAPTDCSDTSADCDADALAAHDKYQWEQALDGSTAVSGGNSISGLVSPTGCVIVHANDGGAEPNGFVTVVVAWRSNTSLVQTVSSQVEECLTGRESLYDITISSGTSTGFVNFIEMKTFILGLEA